MNKSLKNSYANEGLKGIIKGPSPTAFKNYCGNYLEGPSEYKHPKSLSMLGRFVLTKKIK